MIALEYEYHDANLVSVSYSPRHEASLVFDLYPIFYADKPTVTLRFGGIFNHESTAKFVASVNDDAHDPDCYLTRCNVIQIDTKKPSKDGDIFVFVDLDHYGQIRIHCQNLSELKT